MSQHFIRLCGRCTWETPAFPAFDDAHSALWEHYNTKHAWTKTNGNWRRK